MNVPQHFFLAALATLALWLTTAAAPPPSWAPVPLSLEIQVPIAFSSLVDVSTNHWAYQVTRRVIDQDKTMLGFPDHTFRGHLAVSRYELALSLHRGVKRMEALANASLAANAPPLTLNDVPPSDHWAGQAVDDLIKRYGALRALAGVAEGVFRGDQPVTRAELAVGLADWLGRAEAAGALALAPERALRLGALMGDVLPGDPAAKAIADALDRYRVMTPARELNFHPARVVVRYELAAALERAMKLLKK